MGCHPWQLKVHALFQYVISCTWVVAYKVILLVLDRLTEHKGRNQEITFFCCPDMAASMSWIKIHSTGMLLYMDKYGGSRHTPNTGLRIPHLSVLNLTLVPQRCGEGTGLLRHLHLLSPQVCLKEMRKWLHSGYMLEYKTEQWRKWSGLYVCLFFYNQELQIHLYNFTFGTVMLKKKKGKWIASARSSFPSPIPENH